MPSFKLTYFDGRGRAEISRLIFAAAGATYEDIRIKDWPKGKEESPLGQLPYLTVDGLKVPQGVAIARFLARLFNMYGRDELECLKTDAAVDTFYDLQFAYYTKIYPPTKNPEAVSKFLSEDAVTHLTRFEKIISMYGSENYTVGDQFTWADLSLYDSSSLLVNLKSDILKDYPKVQAVRKTVESHPRIAEYLKNRPVTDF